MRMLMDEGEVERELDEEQQQVESDREHHDVRGYVVTDDDLEDKVEEETENGQKITDALNRMKLEENRTNRRQKNGKQVRFAQLPEQKRTDREHIDSDHLEMAGFDPRLIRVESGQSYSICPAGWVLNSLLLLLEKQLRTKMTTTISTRRSRKTQMLHHHHLAHLRRKRKAGCLPGSLLPLPSHSQLRLLLRNRSKSVLRKTRRHRSNGTMSSTTRSGSDHLMNRSSRRRPTARQIRRKRLRRSMNITNSFLFYNHKTSDNWVKNGLCYWKWAG